MPRGGARPGAGRPRGAWSKRRVEDMRRVGPMGERALAVLTAAMENPKVPWSARITAAGMIADRAFGRAPQSVSLDVTRRLNELSICAIRFGTVSGNLGEHGFRRATPVRAYEHERRLADVFEAR
jgi:hypothetical protein